MIPPRKKSAPPARNKKPKPPTEAELADWKDQNPGKMHPYWINRMRYYHAGEKSIAKIED